MSNNEKEVLKNYIKKELKKGFPLKEIKNKLIEADHPKDMVKVAISDVEGKKKPKIKGKVLPFIIGVSVLIIIAGGILLFQKTTRHEEGAYSAEMSEKAIEKELRSCLNANGKIKNIYYDLCRAIASRDITLCNNDNLCQGKVYLAEALDKNDPLICENINQSVYKNICLALFNKDETVCEGAPSETERKDCINFIKNAVISLHNPEEIEKVCKSEPYDKSFEFWCKSTLSWDENVCTEALEYGCYTIYYIAMAILKKDESFCEKIAMNLEEIEYCKSQISLQ